MRYRIRDANGDWTFGQSAANFYVDSPEAVGQAVQTRLQLQEGDWFLDTSDGTPWSTKILGRYTRNTYESVLRARILGTPGVTQITEFYAAYQGATRIASVQVSLDTQYGTSPLVNAPI